MELKRIYIFVFIIMLCFMFSGCSLLQAPFALLKVPFGFLGGLFKVLNKIPKPPPWVFL